MSLLRAAAFCAVMSLASAAPSFADPLLTKKEIANAAAEIEACIAKENGASGGRAANCIGAVRGSCDDAISAGGDAAHATCADNETAAWDVILNRAWSTMPQALGKERFAALRNVQKLWLSYRDAKCAFLDEEQGAWGLMLEAACRLDETARRTLELLDIAAP